MTQQSSPEQSSPELADAETDWRRLDARMLLVHPVRELIRFLPALAAIFIAGRRSDGNDWWELSAVLAIVVVGALRWLTTRYRIENGQIELRKGLVNKQVIATPADRVRTVDVTAPIFHRLLGLAKVQIGTAGGGDHADRLVLDSLATREARHLRGELLHRQAIVPAVRGTHPSLPLADGAPTAGDAADAVTSAWVTRESAAETTLLTLDPAWVRYAPLTLSGVVSALAIFGFGSQFVSRLVEGNYLATATDRIEQVSLWAALTLGVVGVAVTVSLLAVIGYVLSFWGFRLTRHTGGSLHVSRGLLTTRETSIEEARLRGLEIGEPLGLRLAGAGRLQAITTGLSKKETERGSAWLVPPAPRAIVEHVAAAVVRDPDALSAPLTAHGPAALRRRYIRAVVPALLAAAVVVVLAVRGSWPAWVFVLAAVPVLGSPFLARDRYAGLGHHLTPHHFVVSSGSLSRRRDALARTGVIGWNLRQTFFQRRSGLATLTATTAAGKQGYHLHDVREPRAVLLSREVTPALLEQFLAR